MIDSSGDLGLNGSSEAVPLPQAFVFKQGKQASPKFQREFGGSLCVPGVKTEAGSGYGPFLFIIL